ncbi:glycerol-3-phosphate dehydrogenase [Metamycoplasma cloacale]|uniref:Glycerol-3-phosphate dehydrogenase n=1 Tax=Metamycoplasma cloacale TaxID=92401 RepID=A0A2Z4LMK5_9BACT|nr:glycerol-3-phosphate dehydrogenase [Metamycoplasma cloacale]
MKRISIIGSGAMGTACAVPLHDNKLDVTIYGIDQQELNDLSKGCNLKYFNSSFDIPCFKTTNNLDEVINSDYILLAVPTKFAGSVVDEIIAKIKPNQKVTLINVAKGFWPNSNVSIHEAIKEKIKNHSGIVNVVSLIGPSFAIELVQRKITLMSAVCDNLKVAQDIQELFSNHYLRIYTQTDIKGAETGAIFKNMLAIATGMLDGLGYSMNTQCALLTRAFKEIELYNEFIGGKKETLYGLTCLGDLMLTCLSDKSRNYTFGKQYIQSRTINTNMTVEGLNSIQLIYNEYIKTKILNLPIIKTLYEILYKNYSIEKAIQDLLTSHLRCE